MIHRVFALGHRDQDAFGRPVRWHLDQGRHHVLFVAQNREDLTFVFSLEEAFAQLLRQQGGRCPRKSYSRAEEHGRSELLPRGGEFVRLLAQNRIEDHRQQIPQDDLWHWAQQFHRHLRMAFRGFLFRRTDTYGKSILVFLRLLLLLLLLLILLDLGGGQCLELRELQILAPLGRGLHLPYLPLLLGLHVFLNHGLQVDHVHLSSEALESNGRLLPCHSFPQLLGDGVGQFLPLVVQVHLPVQRLKSSGRGLAALLGVALRAKILPALKEDAGGARTPRPGFTCRLHLQVVQHLRGVREAQAFVSVGQHGEADEHVRLSELRRRAGLVLGDKGNCQKPPAGGGLFVFRGRKLALRQQPVLDSVDL
mmetsp:Transcript_17861/g.42447  ORF Transcript_17861/g.42447 Transcript_17861/m.42447 type:complete len:365 (+) Transcript_17861:1086-2180(+)